jgi:hypothetical protein
MGSFAVTDMNRSLEREVICFDGAGEPLALLSQAVAVHAGSTTKCAHYGAQVRYIMDSYARGVLAPSELDRR